MQSFIRVKKIGKILDKHRHFCYNYGLMSSVTGKEAAKILRIEGISGKAFKIELDPKEKQLTLMAKDAGKGCQALIWGLDLCLNTWATETQTRSKFKVINQFRK
jgi:hypothetical protein